MLIFNAKKLLLLQFWLENNTNDAFKFCSKDKLTILCVCIGCTLKKQAFEEAWTAACKVEGSTMVVPSGSVFLVKPISFSGPNCQPNIVFQVKKTSLSLLIFLSPTCHPTNTPSTRSLEHRPLALLDLLRKNVLFYFTFLLIETSKMMKTKKKN